MAYETGGKSLNSVTKLDRAGAAQVPGWAWVGSLTMS